MFKLVSLFFHLGLHIGNLGRIASTSMYNYVAGNRFSRSIYSVRISILYIRKVTLFLLVSSKLNHCILPVLRGFTLQATYEKGMEPTSTGFTGHTPAAMVHTRTGALHSITRTAHTRKTLYSLRRYTKLRSLKCTIERRLKTIRIRRSIYARYMVSLKRAKHTQNSKNIKQYTLVERIFRKYNALYLRYCALRRRYLKKYSTVYLASRRAWLNSRYLDTLYKYLPTRQCVGEDYVSNHFGNDLVANLFNRYSFPVLLNKTGLINNWLTYYITLRNAFSEVIPKYTNAKVFTRVFMKKPNVTDGSDFLYNCITLIMCLYYKLNTRLELNMINYRLKFDNLVVQFRKFYVFMKFLIYLRGHMQLPSTLFYFDPVESELSTVGKYRICTISLVDSSFSTMNYVTYPIPSSFGTYLSRFFYASLFINAYFIGRILLVLSSIN